MTKREQQAVRDAPRASEASNKLQASKKIRVVPNIPVVEAADQNEDGELASLFQSVYAQLAEHGTKVVQFVGPSGGEGTSTIARRFALLSASETPGPVCLIDVGPKRLAHEDGFGSGTSTSWPIVASSDRPIEDGLSRVPGSDLYVANAARGAAVGVLVQQLDTFIQKVRSNFALIVLDSMSIGGSVDALLMSRKVDGVVLVIEAEKTRQAMAEAACQKIARAGGQVIGVVLNKRRQHLPGFLRQLLETEEPSSDGREPLRRRVGRAFGLALVAFAIAAAGYELVVATHSGRYRIIGFGEIWSQFNPSSLDRMLAALRRYEQAEIILRPVLQTMLAWPTWAFAGIPGVALLLGLRRRKGSQLSQTDPAADPAHGCGR